MHLTHATYLPNLLLKMVTATESRHVTVRDTTLHTLVIVKSYMFMCLLLDNFEGGLTKTVPWGTFGALF